MTKDEELAMDLTLEALEQGIDGQTSIQMDKAITAIKQARSAPYVASPRVQEPVAFNAGVPPLYPEMKDGETISVEYTTPPAAQRPVAEPHKWVGLTEQEWERLVELYGDDPDILIRETEAKLREKNAAQRQWVGLIRGVRVEGDTVVITVKGGNDAARELCGALLEEKNT
jgi:hypothetical protein